MRKMRSLEHWRVTILSLPTAAVTSKNKKKMQYVENWLVWSY